MKIKGIFKNAEKTAAKVNAKTPIKKQPERAVDFLAVNERDTGKVKAVDGNPTV